jgi:hexosaminidase
VAEASIKVPLSAAVNRCVTKTTAFTPASYTPAEVLHSFTSMRNLIIAQMVCLLASLGVSQTQPRIDLMPMPSGVQAGTGELAIDRTFSISVAGFHDAALDRGVQRFVEQLSRQTGMRLDQELAAVASPTLLIQTERDREKVQRVGEDESYELVIAESGAKLTAANPLGVQHGLQTFLQLLQITPSGFAVPVVTIKDAPRFAWRGLLIDVSRHFIPLEALKRNVDGMAAVKLNVLHWHLSDDQGFRVESVRFPKLHEMGSDGMYYTQEEIREFVSYAHDRGIRVIPEFDMPGHSRSWFVGYPELASGPGPYKVEPGAPDAAMDPTREETYKFLDKFVGEMAGLFPDAYFHLGGDEVSGKQWDANAKIQAFLHSHGMKNNQDLQAYFNQRLQKILHKHHKIMVGWDEILHPALPKTIVVQSWRGQQSLATAAQQGYSGLLSYGYYLDLMWPAGRHYAVDPMADATATLNAQEKSRILGGEACLWSEFVSPETIDSRLWPRTAAIAERFWSPQEIKDVDSMYARLGDVSWRLEWLGLRHRSNRNLMLHRLAGGDDIAALRTLADVVEPVKDYTRPDNVKGVWDFRAPLNRLVDAVSPESEGARRFGDLVKTFIQSGYKEKASEGQIRVLLAAWRDNDAKLAPALQQSFLLHEVAPLSKDMSALGTAGLQALDYLDNSQLSPEAWRTEQLAAIRAAQVQRADLLMMVAAPVQQLVEASGVGVH